MADIDDSKVSSEETWSSQKTNEEFIKIHKKIQALRQQYINGLLLDMTLKQSRYQQHFL